MIQKVVSGLLLLSIISSLNGESVKVIVEIAPTWNIRIFVHVYSTSGSFSSKQVFSELGVIEVPLEEDLADLKLDAVLSTQTNLDGMFGVPIMGGNIEKKDSVWLVRTGGLRRAIMDGKKCPDECSLENKSFEKLVTPETNPTTTVFPDSTDGSQSDSSTGPSDSTSTQSGMAASLHDSAFVLIFPLIFSFIVKNKVF